MAGGDDKLLGFLGRFHSKDAAVKAWKQQHDDIRSGKWVKPLDENASDEDKAAWNKLLGVPDKPEGYFEKLPDGLVVGDDDRPGLERVLAKAHAAGVPSSAANAMIEGYYDWADEQIAAEAEANDNARKAGEDALRAEWGGDYRRNLNALQNHLQTLPEAVSEALLGGRDANGIALANNPAMIKWLASLALDANPLATVVPGAGANAGTAIAEEIASIENFMRTNRAAYNRDEAKQARLRQLYDAREKMK
jgi:hypothetical protein